jgi:hypothetical protein
MYIQLDLDNWSSQPLTRSPGTSPKGPRPITPSPIGSQRSTSSGDRRSSEHSNNSGGSRSSRHNSSSSKHNTKRSNGSSGGSSSSSSNRSANGKAKGGGTAGGSPPKTKVTRPGLAPLIIGGTGGSNGKDKFAGFTPQAPHSPVHKVTNCTLLYIYSRQYFAMISDCIDSLHCACALRLTAGAVLLAAAAVLLHAAYVWLTLKQVVACL